MPNRTHASVLRWLFCCALILLPVAISHGDDAATSSSPKKLEVNFWVVEVPIDKLRNMGFDWAQITPDGVKHSSAHAIESIAQTPMPADQCLTFLKTLEQNNLARTLCQPTLVTLDGRPASLEISPYLELDVVPIVLGNGSARLEYRVKISQDAPKQDEAKTQSQTTPRSASFKSDAATELELGKASLVSHTRLDRTTADGKSQSTEVLVIARVDVLKSSTLTTGN